MCKLSIITITLNSEKHLEQTIQSVIQQNYQNLEYILVDGGSNDGTIGIIKKYEDHIAKWISESDSGIADAMNKGLKLSTGDYILFIHSDDYLVHEKVIEQAFFEMTRPNDIFLFDIFLEKNGNRTLCSPKGLLWWTNFKTTIFHQACFCSKDLFKKIGLFDKTFQITMDFDFFLRAYRAGACFSYIASPLCVMRLEGISSQLDWPNLKMRFLEEKRVHFKNCPNLWMKYIYKLYWNFYFPYRKVKSFISKN